VLNVTVPVGADVNKAALYDVLGRDTGLTMSNGTINTAGLSKGIYMFVLETTEGNFTTKVVKQ
ncbi:MAG: T9SS type A sorting domain-containing protein, partial [Gilvibacter sp.]